MAVAQPVGRPGGGRNGPGQQGGRGQGGGGGRPGIGGQQGGQQAPWVAIFDTDGDGEISEAEIKNAAASLMKLDRNADGKIGGDELRPAGGRAGVGQQRAGGRGGAPGGGRPGVGQGQAGGGGRPGGGAGQTGGGGPRGGDPAKADASFAAQILTLDSNENGLITLDELPDHMHKAFKIADADSNGSLNQKELLTLAAQFRRNKLNPDSEQEIKNAPTQGRPGR